MKIKLIALAVAALVSGGANATLTLDTANANNNDMFINMWDATGSFTKAIGANFGTFNTLMASGGSGDLLTLNLAADTSFQAFIAGRTSYSWDIIGVNTVGNASTISSWTSASPLASSPTNTVMKTGTNNVLNYVGSINGAILNSTAAATNGVDSVYTNSITAPTYVTANASVATGLFVSPTLVAGTQANNSFASGLHLIKEAAALTGNVRAVQTLYSGVTAYMDNTSTLHIGSVAAVPEADSLAMLLAGMGLVGSIARRRNRKTA